ncbi:conserved hypothetical protein [Candidatus Sulfopaludibacter sp. SbA3]|nr:conserved hypothetical protein [Candidatus Sulfopaludibacter sp. SbA3]
MTHALVYARGGTSSQIPFASLTEISVRAEINDNPQTLQLDYSADGDRARVVSYAIYLTGRKKLADHRARLHESVKLAELQSLGYLPITLRVVPPNSAGAPAARAFQPRSLGPHRIQQAGVGFHRDLAAEPLAPCCGGVRRQRGQRPVRPHGERPAKHCRPPGDCCRSKRHRFARRKWADIRPRRPVRRWVLGGRSNRNRAAQSRNGGNGSPAASDQRSGSAHPVRPHAGR